MSLACGENFILFVDYESTVWVWGNNKQGQLGYTGRDKISRFEALDGVPPIFVAVACGFQHSFLLDAEGFVWASGWHLSGQLGLGSDTTQREKFEKIPTVCNITSISTKGKHSLFLDANGDVWSTGSNSDGQLGLGGWLPKFVPTKIAFKSVKFSAIACGDKHSLFLGVDGSVWSCGANNCGQLGINSNVSQIFAPSKVLNIPEIRAIAAGNDHSILLDYEGTPWGFGSNAGCQLGLDTTEFRVVKQPLQIKTLKLIDQIACGGDHTLFLDAMGKVYGCGRAQKINCLNNLPQVEHIAAGAKTSLFLDSSGSLWIYPGSHLLGATGEDMFQKVEDIPQLLLPRNMHVKMKSART